MEEERKINENTGNMLNGGKRNDCLPIFRIG